MWHLINLLCFPLYAYTAHGRVNQTAVNAYGNSCISYCGIALQYVEEYYQLFAFIIGCFPYNAASHSAQHLRKFVNKILEEYKLQLDSTKFVVTDNEPKILPAFLEQCSRVDCADHYLNKQLQHAFQSDQIHLNKNTIEKVDCELVQNIFSQVKKVVSCVRHSHQ
ncbi:unnamed protein product [Rotaria sp. Silwood2]|nr:unnamed protein product [Rotaria sp. Silwood2]CAF4744147.1 unnamed protein product [Rotaria sp. Silwood2]